MTWFTKQDFYLITRLRCDEPHDIELEPQRISLLREYFSNKLGLVGESSKGRKEKGKGKAKSTAKKVTNMGSLKWHLRSARTRKMPLS